MENNKENLFTSYRWHEDVGTIVIGYEETTEGEKEKAKIKLDKILKDRGMKK